MDLSQQVALRALLYPAETWQQTGPQGPVCAPWLSESDQAADQQISPSNETEQAAQSQLKRT